MLYPWISEWLYEHQNASEASAYADALEEAEASYLDEVREEAEEYNALLTQSKVVLTDPFAGDASGQTGMDYASLLLTSLPVMGYIDIPCIDVYLPVYHGTDAATLLAGIGHLEGSSLPVGGESTHAVLTGHTGLSNAKMFTDLTELVEGDYFFFHVLGEVLAYRVVQIQVVLPEEPAALLVQPGRDLMTLVTCTPYGVNSHRLYVTGERCAYSDELYAQAGKGASDNRESSQWMRSYRRAVAIALAVFIVLCAGIGLWGRRISCHKRLSVDARDVSDYEEKHTNSIDN